LNAVSPWEEYDRQRQMRSSPTFAGLDRQPLHDERVQGTGLRPLERLRMTDVGVRATWRDHGRNAHVVLFPTSI
jgi:hypothetical protein